MVEVCKNQSWVISSCKPRFKVELLVSTNESPEEKPLPQSTCFSFSHFRCPSSLHFLCFFSSLLPLSHPLSFLSFVLSFPAQFPNKQIIAERASECFGQRTSESVSDKTAPVRPFVYLISNPICFRSQATSTLGLRKHASSLQRHQRHATATGPTVGPASLSPLASAKAPVSAAMMWKAPSASGVCRRGGPLRLAAPGVRRRCCRARRRCRRSRNRRDRRRSLTLNLCGGLRIVSCDF